MDNASSLQQKFISLLKETTVFFAAQDLTPDLELKAINHLRAGALDLISEVNQPYFEYFLAYLMGVSDIEAEYPLQTIRFACLVAHAAHKGELSKWVKRDDLVTAAFLADLGFRLAWQGHKKEHCDVTVLRLKQLDPPWFTPIVEELVLHHHHPGKDASPYKIFSLCARYLALAYGAGIDEGILSTISAAKAMEELMADREMDSTGIKLLLKTLSAFPLGSWVELNSGEPALIVGSNINNPLRPRLGVYRSAWEEHNLQTELTRHVIGEHAPNAFQQSFVNHPQFWAPGWVGEKTLPKEELKKGFQPIRSVDSVKTEAIVPTIDHARTVEAFLAEPKTPSASVGLHAATEPGAMSKTQQACYEDELQHLRSDWEHHVRLVEETTDKLKSGLLESYKRENEKYKSIIDRLEKAAGASPAAVDTPPSPPSAPAPETPKPQATETAAPPVKKEASPSAPEATNRKNEEIEAALKKERESLQNLLAKTQENLQNLRRTVSQHEGEILQERPAIREVLDRWDSKVHMFEMDILQKPSLKEPINASHPWTQTRRELERVASLAQAFKDLLSSKISLSYFYKGMAQKAAGNTTKAIFNFQKAIEVNPAFWEPHAYIGLCYLRERDDRAVGELEQALTLNPTETNVQACLKLARELQKS